MNPTTPTLRLHCLHLPDTRSIGVWRFFPLPFLHFAPADPVGYLSHVLRLHREREKLLDILYYLYLCTCIYFYIYIFLALYRFCV